jgi:hypothetical protein
LTARPAAWRATAASHAGPIVHKVARRFIVAPSRTLSGLVRGRGRARTSPDDAFSINDLHTKPDWHEDCFT